MDAQKQDLTRPQAPLPRLVEPGEIQWVTQRFDADEEIAQYWSEVAAGKELPTDEFERFRHTLAHEFVEQGLMQHGWSYRSDSPSAWVTGLNEATSRAFGAHDIAPRIRIDSPVGGRDMSQSDRVHAAVTRIRIIDWQFDDTRHRSHVALVEEYLRRVAVWSHALQRDAVGKLPNLPQLVDGPSQVPDALVDQVEAQVPGSFGAPVLTRMLCILYVQWEAIVDEPHVQAFALPHPYEPLMRLYERGGYVQSSKIGGFEVGSTLILLSEGWWKRYTERDPLEALDDATLDVLDQAAVQLIPAR